MKKISTTIAQPDVTVFDRMLSPIQAYIEQQGQQRPPHHNETFSYPEFFRLLAFYFVSEISSIALLLNTSLKKGLLSPTLKRRFVPRSTFKDAFERFSPALFRAVLQHLLSTLTVQTVLPVNVPDAVCPLFRDITDQIISCDNDPYRHVSRLVRFCVGGSEFFLLTDRRDLITFQVMLLYAYRWQVELIFRFLKRTMNGIHLINHSQEGGDHSLLNAPHRLPAPTSSETADESSARAVEPGSASRPGSVSRPDVTIPQYIKEHFSQYSVEEHTVTSISFF